MSANVDINQVGQQETRHRNVEQELEEVEVREVFDSLLLLRSFANTNFTNLLQHWEDVDSRRIIIDLIATKVYPHLPLGELDITMLHWQSYAAVLLKALATAEIIGTLASINRDNIYSKLQMVGTIPAAALESVPSRDRLETSKSKKRTHSPLQHSYG